MCAPLITKMHNVQAESVLLALQRLGLLFKRIRQHCFIANIAGLRLQGIFGLV